MGAKPVRPEGMSANLPISYTSLWHAVDQYLTDQWSLTWMSVPDLLVDVSPVPTSDPFPARTKKQYHQDAHGISETMGRCHRDFLSN